MIGDVVVPDNKDDLAPVSGIGKKLQQYALSIFDMDDADFVETCAEMTLGQIMDLDEVLIDIPVAGTLKAIMKSTSTIRDVFALKKFLVFQNRFNSEKAESEEVEKRKRAVLENQKWIKKEIEFLLVKLDYISDERNAKVLGSLYVKYLNRECTLDEFEETATVLERFIYQDAEKLLQIYHKHLIGGEGIKPEPKDSLTMSRNNHCDRLVALGLVWPRYTTVLNGGLMVDYNITKPGIYIAEALENCL